MSFTVLPEPAVTSDAFAVRVATGRGAAATVRINDGVLIPAAFTALTELPGLENKLAAGRYAPLLNWLRTKIHCVGQRLQPPELIAAATGQPTRAEYHLTALREKFTE